ncbi:glycogen debranching enzyme family protein [Dactylosporangium roseum]|uniref:Glycogen debranching enzyme family protein n=1 Tax=Dactylosporangium roseum TaxID=47989 RepID=A0ABY5ZCQ0_9ACTN|nr:amylo-alpha-1,6-glucosidase [Dactylosporangium roseum]UWZ39908.1 glycogen debranching enzyme family protein [Dactylosporangium roseum]
MPPGSVTFGPHVCTSAPGFESEWLVTDGLGGYATGTVAGLRTRRYHGLLVTPDRRLALAALDPVLTLPGGITVRLGVHEWASGAIAPTGHLLLEQFQLTEGVPRWRWRVGEFVLERELAMVHGRNAVAVVHRLVGAPAGSSVGLTLTALCTWRDADTERDRTGPPLTVEPIEDTGWVEVEGAYRIAGPGFQPAGDWYLGACAREEAARGLNPVEDLWAAGTFAATLAVGEALDVTAWSGDLDTAPPRAGAVVQEARRRARRLVRAAGAREAADKALVLAADQFIVTGADGAPAVIAGYPWFGSYLRDTMTAYEGLFLHTGRHDEGRRLLRAHASLGERMRTAALGDADGPLWYVHAVERHVARTDDTGLAAELLPALERVVAAYTKGTRDGVTVDPADGLLVIDADHSGLTWMNARLPRGPVTPRDGKPVELNALWANALGAVSALRERCGRDASVVQGRRDAVRAQFIKRFRAPDGWLFDVVDARPAPYPKGGGGVHDDAVLRPNQLLAFSLPFAPAADEPHLRETVLRAVGSTLLTPLGLRTLAPSEFGYHGSHRGGVVPRDTAYHQGTVWPWLLGPYVDARCAAGLPVDAALTAVEAHLGECGLGSVSEIAEGDAPHRATGAPFSARSVAAVLHARAVIRQSYRLQPAQNGKPGTVKLTREGGPRQRRNALR